MDYLKLKKAVDTNKFGIAGLFKKLGMDRSGFYYSIDNQTMKVETMERICEAINMPVWELFYKSKPFEGQENPLAPEISKLKDRVIELQDELAECKEMVYSSGVAAEEKQKYQRKKTKGK